jgi:hypothetical protein
MVDDYLELLSISSVSYLGNVLKFLALKTLSLTSVARANPFLLSGSVPIDFQSRPSVLLLIFRLLSIWPQSFFVLARFFSQAAL